MSDKRAKRKLAAILSADVKDYSRLMGEDELGTVARIKACRRLFAQCAAEYRGRVVDSPGDNILAEFSSAVDAVECALHLQVWLAAENSALPPDRRMEFRLGINLGDVIEDEGGIYGDGVNIAARVQSLAKGGGICISGTIYDQIETKLPLQFNYLGEHQIKNLRKPIRVYAIDSKSIECKPSPKPAPQKKSWKRIAAIPAAFLIIAGLWVVDNRKSPDTSRHDLTIAVLPFADMSPNRDQEYFADGLAEELLNILSQIPELRVVGRTSSFQFKGKNEDLRSIGRKLNASAILEGSVRQENGRMRITVQLINTGSGFHLWSETYNPKNDDIFAMQDQISNSVAQALKVTLIRGATTSSGTKNSQAYNAYLLGQYYAERRTPADLQKAVEYYDDALGLDSSYALAWVALAVVRIRQADWGHVAMEAGYADGREAASRALAINPNLAIAHSILGRIMMSHDWNWTGADDELKLSLKLEPGNASVVSNAAALFVTLGRIDECMSMARRAVQLDPLNLTSYYIYATYAYYSDSQEEARVAIEKALELKPDGSGFRQALGLILLEQGKPGEALTEIEQETDPGWRLQGLALVYHALKRKKEADAALAELIAKYQFDSAFQIAEVYSFRQDFDQAFEWLERAYKQHDSGLHLVKVDPLMNNLKGDPRYTAFLKKMHLYD